MTESKTNATEIMTEFTTEFTEVEVSPAPDMDALMATLKSLEPSDLFKVMKQAIAEAEKRSKSTPKATSTKKAGSMPKGKVPPQLRKPRAWVDFTLKHALENGWESFTVHQTKKDKETGEKFDEEILQPGSIMHEGAYVYEDSVTAKNPNGKQLIHKDAMSLSKQRWDRKEATGTHEELYKEFLSSYVEEIPESTSETSRPVVKMTAAEKEKLAEEKKAEKLRLAEEKKAEKLRLAEEKKAEKLREKEEKKAEKLREKEEKKAEKKSTKSTVPAAAVKSAVKPVKAAAVKVPTPVLTPVPVAVPTPVKKAIVKAVPKVEWTCPNDGMIHPWPYKGKTYLRNFENELWLRGVDGQCGEWQGVYIPAEDRIDDTVAEPEFEEE